MTLMKHTSYLPSGWDLNKVKEGDSCWDITGTALLVTGN